MTCATNLRSQLLVLRHDALRQLAGADQIQPGFLALLAGINAALLAVDAEATGLLGDAARAVLVDDGQAIRLVAYNGADRGGGRHAVTPASNHPRWRADRGIEEVAMLAGELTGRF